MENMKVIVKWEGDPFWMNPDNLLIVLRKHCPNTKFECEYIIHPNEEDQIKEKIKKQYDRGRTLKAIILKKIKKEVE